jgi:hypothetical protein
MAMPLCMVLRLHKFPAKKSITEMYHPSYSPDLAPCEFWLFPKLNNALKGQRNVTVFQKTISKILSGSGTTSSQSAQRHKDGILKERSAASAQVCRFCFHRAISGIKLLHDVQLILTTFQTQLANTQGYNSKYEYLYIT